MKRLYKKREQTGGQIFDTLGETDDGTFYDGEVVSILLGRGGDGPARIYQFSEGVDNGEIGDYEISGTPAGFLNRVGSTDMLTVVLEEDQGPGSGVINRFNQLGQGGGDIDIDSHYKSYIVRRHPVSLDVATFDSGGVTIAADDFDWHMFRRVSDSQIDYMGKPFSAAAPALTVAKSVIQSLDPAQKNVQCNEDNTCPVWAWDATDQSALITSDPRQGWSIAPASDLTGASGCWRAKFQGMPHVEWWYQDADGIDYGLAFNAGFDAGVQTITANYNARLRAVNRINFQQRTDATPKGIDCPSLSLSYSSPQGAFEYDRWVNGTLKIKELRPAGGAGFAFNNVGLARSCKIHIPTFAGSAEPLAGFIYADNTPAIKTSFYTCDIRCGKLQGASRGNDAKPGSRFVDMAHDEVGIRDSILNLGFVYGHTPDPAIRIHNQNAAGSLNTGNKYIISTAETCLAGVIDLAGEMNSYVETALYDNGDMTHAPVTLRSSGGGRGCTSMHIKYNRRAGNIGTLADIDLIDAQDTYVDAVGHNNGTSKMVVDWHGSNGKKINVKYAEHKNEGEVVNLDSPSGAAVPVSKHRFEFELIKHAYAGATDIEKLNAFIVQLSAAGGAHVLVHHLDIDESTTLRLAARKGISIGPAVPGESTITLIGQPRLRGIQFSASSVNCVVYGFKLRFNNLATSYPVELAGENCHIVDCDIQDKSPYDLYAEMEAVTPGSGRVDNPPVVHFRPGAIRCSIKNNRFSNMSAGIYATKYTQDCAIIGNSFAEYSRQGIYGKPGKDTKGLLIEGNKFYAPVAMSPTIPGVVKQPVAFQGDADVTLRWSGIIFKGNYSTKSPAPYISADASDSPGEESTVWTHATADTFSFHAIEGSVIEVPISLGGGEVNAVNLSRGCRNCMVSTGVTIGGDTVNVNIGAGADLIDRCYNIHLRGGLSGNSGIDLNHDHRDLAHVALTNTDGCTVTGFNFYSDYLVEPEYDAAKTYVAGERITTRGDELDIDAGSTWESVKAANAGNPIVEGEWWTRFVVAPVYDAAATYSIGDTITVPGVNIDKSDWLTYTSAKGYNTGHVITDTDWWLVSKILGIPEPCRFPITIKDSTNVSEYNNAYPLSDKMVFGRIQYDALSTFKRIEAVDECTAAEYPNIVTRNNNKGIWLTDLGVYRHSNGDGSFTDAGGATTLAQVALYSDLPVTAVHGIYVEELGAEAYSINGKWTIDGAEIWDTAKTASYTLGKKVWEGGHIYEALPLPGVIVYDAIEYAAGVDRSGDITVEAEGFTLVDDVNKLVNGSSFRNSANAVYIQEATAGGVALTPGSKIIIGFNQPRILTNIQLMSSSGAATIGGMWKWVASSDKVNWTDVSTAEEFTANYKWNFASNTLARLYYALEYVSGLVTYNYISEFFPTTSPLEIVQSYDTQPSTEDGTTLRSWAKINYPLLDANQLSITALYAADALPPIVGPALNPNYRLKVTNLERVVGKSTTAILASTQVWDGTNLIYEWKEVAAP